MGGDVNLAEEIIGTEAYDKLLSFVGGVDYTIPTNIESRRGKQLTDWIGLTAANKLIAWGAGDTFYVGGGHGRIIRQRAKLLKDMHESGKSINELARVKFEFTYSDRHIRRMLSGDLDALINDLDNDNLF